MFLDGTTDAVLDLAGRAQTRPAIYEALRRRYSKQQINTALRKLEQNGILSTKPAPLVTQIYNSCKTLTLTLNVCHSCNLRCRYCYIDGGVLSRTWRMKRQVARQAIDFVLKLNPKVEKLGISFYGGEPLLNFDVVRDTMNYANQRAAELGLPPVDYHLSTNGTLLRDEMVDFLAGQNINVLVSLDGPPQIHDAMRIDAAGHATHSKVMRAVRRLLAAKGSLSVSASAVITQGGCLIDTYYYLCDLGFEDIKISYVRYHHGEFFRLDDSTKEQYIADLRQIALDYLGYLQHGWRPAYYEFNRRILHLWTKTRRVDFCPAGQSRYGVSPDGRIFPCGPAACMGYGSIGSLECGLSKDAVQIFLGQNDIFASSACQQCWGRFLCGGGCPLPLVRGSANSCEVTLEATKLAVYIYLTMRESNEFLLSVLVDEKLPAYVAEIVRSGIDTEMGQCKPYLPM
jgi:uncharacterized protein